MERSLLHQQVDTLPSLLRNMIDVLLRRTRETFSPQLCRRIKRIYITGCGDSHHAALCSELAFEQLAGLSCEPQTAMQFSRYGVSYILNYDPGSSLVLGVSVSGQVSRTIEAVDLARKAGALTIAITGSRAAPLADASDHILETTVPPLPEEMDGTIVPGTQSYFSSLLALYVLAIHLGQERGNLSKQLANRTLHELAGAAGSMEKVIASCDRLAHQAALAWMDADTFVYCGSGPNYGTALFSAAKLLEASGDSAVPQDMEEWAHLQYFARQESTPTFLISAGKRDVDRTVEIAVAAKALGRRLALIAPDSSPLVRLAGDDIVFPLQDPTRECFSPLLTSIPAILFAAYRAQLLNEPYFRAFGGGRSVEGGGGISRIRSSSRITELKR